MLVCPILLCLAGYEWIKDMFKQQQKKKQPTINLQHSLISSKSIFFATSPFHSLQMTQQVLEHLSAGAGKQGTDHLAWVGGAPFEGKELGLRAAPPD